MGGQAQTISAKVTERDDHVRVEWPVESLVALLAAYTEAFSPQDVALRDAKDAFDCGEPLVEELDLVDAETVAAAIESRMPAIAQEIRDAATSIEDWDRFTNGRWSR